MNNGNVKSIDTVVIMVGGFGTRLSEETVQTPKPLVEIGGHPILWHIMKIYSSFGVKNFILCAGYKQHLIKSYCEKLFIAESDVEFYTSQVLKADPENLGARKLYAQIKSVKKG